MSSLNSKTEFEIGNSATPQLQHGLETNSSITFNNKLKSTGPATRAIKILKLVQNIYVTARACLKL